MADQDFKEIINHQVYLLRLQRKNQTGQWVISLQPAWESRQRVFTDLDSLTIYLHEQMSGNREQANEQE